MTDVLFLSSDDVSGLADQSAFVDAVHEAYRQRGHGAPAKPRTALTTEDPPGLFTTYAAVLPETGVMGGYMYSAGFGGGDAWFVTPLFDADSGELLAVVDGASMNPYKTGATGAVGVDTLAKEDASVLTIFGSGTQAKGQLRATATVRDLEEVRVYSPTADHRADFAETMAAEIDVSIDPVSSPEGALDGADIVITATNATDPVFDGTALDPGTHVTVMGQYDPACNEVDPTTIERSVYVPDLKDRVLQDAGSFLTALEAGVIDPDHVHAELGEVVAGTASRRTTDDQITVFDSGGTGIETTAGAFLLYERARDAGLGTTVEFSPASEALFD